MRAGIGLHHYDYLYLSIGYGIGMVMGSLHPDVVGCTFMDVEAGSVAECIQRGLPCLRNVSDPMLWGRLQYRESEATIVGNAGTPKPGRVPRAEYALRVPASKGDSGLHLGGQQG
jgi:hypothetical protein